MDNFFAAVFLSVVLWGCLCERFSIVQITDMHIGHTDLMIPQFESVVKKVNELVEEGNYSIKFAIMTGDFTDDASHENLDVSAAITSNLKIPYFPILGNHDVRYQNESYSQGDFRFMKKFGDIIDHTEVGILSDYTGRTEVWNPEGKFHSYFQNYLLNYNGIYFLFCDFNDRVDGHTSRAALHDFEGGTFRWFKEQLGKLNEKIDDVKKIFFVQHHPFMCPWLLPCGDVSFPLDQMHAYEEAITAVPLDKIWGDFSGHMHLFIHYKDVFPKYHDEYSEFQSAATRFLSSFAVHIFEDDVLKQIDQYCLDCPPNDQLTHIYL